MMLDKSGNYQKFSFRTILIFVLIIFISAFSLSLLNNNDSVKVSNGSLDLSSWEKGETFPLYGDWDFYWQKFLTYEDFKNNPEPDVKALIPSVWNNYKIDNKNLSGEGYATYRLHVTGASVGQPISLRISPFSTAYELYIDDVMLTSCGEISSSKVGFEPELKLQNCVFTPQKESFDLIVHVSNFVYARGGIWTMPYMGTTEGIRTMRIIVAARDYFLLGGYFITILYCLALYIIQRDNSLLCLIAMSVFLLIRVLIYGNYAINFFFPFLGFTSTVRLDYLTAFLLIYTFILLMYTYYPLKSLKKPARWMLIYTILVTLSTLILPVNILTKLTYPLESICVIAVLYFAYKVIVSSKKGELETQLVFAGIFILIVFGIRDILFQQNIIVQGYVEYAPMAFILLILLWGSSIGVRYYNALNERERTLIELNESTEREMVTELRFLKAQIHPHFINNALNTIISISRTDTDRSRNLLVDFSKYLRSCYEFSNLQDAIPIETELSFVKSFVAIEKARFQEKIQINYDIDDISIMIPPLILQPLVENAIVHGIKNNQGKGSVLIYIKDKGSYVRIGVKDDGVGIESNRIDKLLKGKTGNRGVGIYNINQRLNKLYHTSLHIENIETGGVDIFMFIPKEGEYLYESSSN